MYRLVRRIRSFEESLVTLFGDGQGLRHRPHLRGAGGGRGRCPLRPDGRRLRHRHPPQPRALHRQGRGRRGDDGGAPRARERLLRRQGRLDAHRRPRPQHAGVQRACERRRPPRGGGGDGGGAPRRAPGRGRVPRGRGREPGDPLRDPEPRGGLEAADHRHLREQPVRR